MSGEPGKPGEFPFTRGIYREMYRSRLWTMRQYAGFGTAEESNRRYHYLLSQGTTGLSVAFDLPTQMGLDSDHPMAAGEVGRVGVAISSLADMETLFQGIRLDGVSTSMTINSTASILLALYALVARAPGRGLAQALGHHPERHSEGIHRARHLHLSAAAGDAHHHRHLRVGRPRVAGVEHHLDQRLSHPRSRIDRGAGTGLHLRQCHRVYRSGDASGLGRGFVRAAPFVLLQRA